MLKSWSSLLFATGVLAACGGSESPAPAPEVAGEPAANPNAIQIKGSDSEVNLVQRLGEDFMAEHPGVSISVTGGGSGTGIAALLDGTVQLATSSRPLSAEEKVRAHRAGIEPVAIVFATDAISVVVNAANPLASLDLDQLGAIFRGEITSWDALGGTGPLVAYGRQSNSGTYVFFRSAVVKGDFGTSVREMNGNAQIVEAVRADPGGIGYVAVGYLSAGTEGLKALNVAAVAGGEAVSPLDEAAVLAERYPIARPLYQYTNGRPTGPLLDFVRFELSAAGAAIAKEMGFYPVAQRWAEDNARILAPTP